MKKLIMLLALLLCLSSVYAFAADNLALHRPVMVSSTTPDAGFVDWGWHKTFIIKLNRFYVHRMDSPSSLR